MLRRYKVLKGVHYDEQGREWKEGDVLQSPLPLSEMFPGKLQDLGPAETPVKQPKLVQNEPEVSEEPAPKKVTVRKKPAIPLEEDWDKA